jgi:hypothetical protein
LVYSAATALYPRPYEDLYRSVTLAEKMIEDFWLERPESLLGAHTEAELESICEHAAAADAGWLEDDLPPNDRSPDEFSKRTAVFAASDGVWPIFYAILDRSLPGLRFLNAALRFEPEPGRLTPMHYFFSVSEGALRSDPWREGVIYILPRQGFVQQPAYELNGRRVHEPHWASRNPVRPLAKIRVSPLDFPFLDRVRGHDNEEIARRSAEHPDGFPWLMT